MRKKIATILIILAIAAGAASCARDGGGDDAPDAVGPDSSISEILTALAVFRAGDRDAHLHPFYGQTLTISVPVNNNTEHFTTLLPIDHAAMQLKAENYMQANPGVNVQVRSFRDFPTAWSTVARELDEGTADTLMAMSVGDFGTGIAEATHLLADWYPIMRADPDFNEEDWLMEAIYARMIGGRLLTFPIDFNFHLISANSLIPGLVDAFGVRDFVTYADLLRLYDQYAGGMELGMYRSFSAIGTFFLHMHEFLDEQAGFDFDTPHFKELMTHARDATVILPAAEHLVTFRTAYYSRYLLNLSRHYVFLDSSVFAYYYRLAEFHHRMGFYNPRPVATDEGRLLASFPTLFELNGAACNMQQAMAWDFVRFFLNPENQHEQTRFCHAIYIPLLRQQAEVGVTDLVEWLREQEYEFYHDLDYTIDSVTRQLINIGRMPMQDMFPVHPSVVAEFFMTLQRFQNNEIDIGQVVEEMQ